ncbi:hypothetical protein BpHYR1_025418 [Brachionus plicatilis]|uniref:Uncharacterized protein n=1 Tax=Brachionus plicatilis TaxID=10195 RepID=A0A3M7RIR4_BRAPC|nr:hypothetical protein BpHYR1_025418 [Brachionus plicatilis]
MKIKEVEIFFHDKLDFLIKTSGKIFFDGVHFRENYRVFAELGIRFSNFKIELNYQFVTQND